MAVFEQAQAIGAHDAAMRAIRNGQFQLKAVKGPTPQAASATDPRDALFSAIKNRQFTLKAVSPAEEQTAGKCILTEICNFVIGVLGACLLAVCLQLIINVALAIALAVCSAKTGPQANDMRACCPYAGAQSRCRSIGKASGHMKLGSPLGGLHALIRQRTAALGTCDESSSNGTGWEI